MADLSNTKVAVLVNDYFEEAEFTEPIQALKETGAHVEVIGPKPGTLHSMNHAEPSNTYTGDKGIADIQFDDYDALVLPGGAVNSDLLRMDTGARKWIQRFMDTGKPIAAICHAPWALVSAGVVNGRTLTSYFTIQDDIRNAGAVWKDSEVVVDHNLITSRQPDDIPAFTGALISMLQTSAR